MLHSSSRCECQPGGLSTFTGLWREMGSSPDFLAQPNYEYAFYKSTTIVGAPTLDSGFKVSGRAGVSREGRAARSGHCAKSNEPRGSQWFPG